MIKANTVTSIALIALLGGTFSAAAHGSKSDKGMKGGVEFSTLDTDNNGQITKQEFEAHKLAHITALDADGNGQISAEELSASMKSRFEARLADKNHSADKTEKKLERMEKKISKRVARMLSKLDANEDGALSIEEMTAKNERHDHFAKRDTNEDGMISEEEFNAKASGDKRGNKRGHK